MNGEPKRLIRESVHTSSALGTSDELVFNQVQPGYEWFVDWVSVRDNTHAMTKWGIFIRRNSADYPIAESTDTTQSQIFGKQVQTWLSEGEKLVVKVSGATASDDLQSWAVGHYRVVGE